MAKRESKGELLVLGQGNVPTLDDWEREAAGAVSKGVAHLATGGNFLSIRGKRFRYNGEDLGDTIEAVLLNFAAVNAYYGLDAAYDPDNPQSPICYAIARVLEDGAIDPDRDNLAPDAVPDKQSEACNGCHWNDFGTAERGRGKACKNMIRIGLLGIEGISDPQKAPIAIMVAPATSIKPFGKYMKELDQAGVPPFIVVTQLSFKPEAEYPELTFTALRYVDKSFKARIRAAYGGLTADLTANSWPTTAEEQRPAQRAAAPRTKADLKQQAPPPAEAARRPRQAAAPKPAASVAGLAGKPKPKWA